MSLYNFVDVTGPVVPAVYLNALDLIRNAISVTNNGNVVISPVTAGAPGTAAITINQAGQTTIASTGGVVYNGVAGVPTMTLNGNPGTGQSLGLLINAGTNGSDYAALINNASGGVQFLKIDGLGRGALGINNTNNLTWDAGGHYSFNAAANAGNPTVTIYGLNSMATALVQAGTGVGTSRGFQINAGTNTSDWALQIYHANGVTPNFTIDGSGQIFGTGMFQTQAGTNNTNYTARFFNASAVETFRLRGDQLIQGVGINSGIMLDMSPDTGSFTATLGGFASTHTGTLNWTKFGPFVMIYLITSSLFGTDSNQTQFYATGVPAEILPTGSLGGNTYTSSNFTDNAVNGCLGCSTVTSGGTITFSKANVAAAGALPTGPVTFNTTGWTSGGATTKGLTPGWHMIYSIY